MGVREPLGTREGVSTVRRSFIPLVVSAVLFAAWGGDDKGPGSCVCRYNELQGERSLRHIG